FESMDRPIPPSRPIEMGHQAYLIGDPYRLRRDVRPISGQEISWQMRVSSPDPVQFTYMSLFKVRMESCNDSMLGMPN
ncbi:MAG: hypothetical protein QGG39_16610, partial [Candidatus Poribacteria bacterium]|nr:hypothetical protein [Candidatus Poribacteria bacterium]